MSQAVLITKKDEWSKRSWGSNASSPTSNETDFSADNNNHHHHTTTTTTTTTTTRKARTGNQRDSLTERTAAVFQPVVERKDSLPWSDSEDTDRASPTSIVSSTTEVEPWALPSLLSPPPPLLDDRNLMGATTTTNGATNTLQNNNNTCHTDGSASTVLEQQQQRRIEELESALSAAQTEMARLKEAADSAQSQRMKTVGNLKKKKTELAQALESKDKLERELEAASTSRCELTEQVASLKLGLSKVAATKDTIKLKLKTKDEMLKESGKEKEGLRQQLQQMEHVHTIERELLDHYRKLARHTGYYRWGKPIRNLEAQLTERGAGETLSSASFS